jgi:alginate O-acetyltransferase complex protein AlgI
MTLGSWFRDYVYIPLGGNRRSAPRVYFNLLAVWLLTGFWHGAGWNFIIWGLFLFVVIAIEKSGLKKIMDKIRPLGHLYMLFLIPLSWMIFAITDMGQLLVYLERLFDFAGTGSDTLRETSLNIWICTES